MKTITFGFVCLAAATSAISVSAQTVNFVVLQWGNGVTQTDTSTTTPVNNSYQFKAMVSGNGLTASAPFSAIALSGNATGSLTPPGVDHGEWDYASSGYANESALLSAFPYAGSPAYTLSMTGGSNPSVNFSAISNPSVNTLNAPLVTFSNGSGVWQPNGKYMITDFSDPITLTFNAVSSSMGGNAFHFDVNIDNTIALSGSPADVTQGFINSDPTGGTPLAGVPTYTIAPGQFIDGNTYTLQIDYAQILQSANLSGDLAGAFSAAVAQIETTVYITTPSAVPEPAGYALIAGLAALVGMIVWRRRPCAN